MMENQQELEKIKEHLTPDIPPFEGGATMSLDEILDGIVLLYRKYVVMTDAQATAIALWVAHTWTYKVCDNTPYISVRSVEIRSGKTTCLFLADELIWKSQLTNNISTSALVHFVEQGCTLLVDEIDNVFGAKDKDATLIGIINSGYRRKGGYTRMIGANNSEPHTFPTFCPKMFAGIGKLPPSIEDRSIVIRLLRKNRSQVTAKFKERIYTAECKPLHTQLEKWSHEAKDHLRNAIPESPKELNDRQEDFWEPLLNIANMASERWAKLAWDSAVELSNVDEEQSIGVRLLTDIRTIYQEQDVGRLFSKELCKHLNDIEESPWGNWGNGNGINQRTLASRLRGYRDVASHKGEGIKPQGIRIGNENLKGYYKGQFVEAWELYCLPVEGEKGETNETSNLNHIYNPTDTIALGNGNVSDSQQIQLVPDVSDVSVQSGGGDQSDDEDEDIWRF